MLKIGHRGACGHAPENTLRSLRKAIELGADAIEFDVQMSKEGVPVVMHDETLNRTTKGKGRVDALTLAELKNLDAGKGEKIPTLEEYIRAMGDKLVFIELKTMASVAATAEVIAKFARAGKPYYQMIVISFLQDALIEIQKCDANILTGLNVEGEWDAAIPAKAQAQGFISVNPWVVKLTQDIVAQVHAQGLKLFTWTANSPADIARAKSYGVDGIISDFPDRL